jgi:hypothetical protein
VTAIGEGFLFWLNKFITPIVHQSQGSLSLKHGEFGDIKWYNNSKIEVKMGYPNLIKEYREKSF